MRLIKKIIPHNEQRYDTCGDWIWTSSGDLYITISDTGNKLYNELIGFHEEIEALLCRQRGITQEEVDSFDMEYEARRPEGDTSEPGDSLKAPYYNEHQFATCLERLMALELGVNWKEYDEKVSSL